MVDLEIGAVWQLNRDRKPKDLGHPSARYSVQTMISSFIESLELGGVVFFSLSFLFCAVVLFFRPFRSLADPMLPDVIPGVQLVDGTKEEAA